MNGSIVQKLSHKEVPPYDSFFNFLRNSNPLENDYNNFENLVKSGLTREQALAKLRMSNVPPIGAELRQFAEYLG